MQRYQEDRGWQSKTVPDSRALIRLGLGPSHDHLLNPESAMTMNAAAPDQSADPASKPTADPSSKPSLSPNTSTATHTAPPPAAPAPDEPSHPYF
jgi:hypothetical protein